MSSTVPHWYHVLVWFSAAKMRCRFRGKIKKIHAVSSEEERKNLSGKRTLRKRWHRIMKCGDVIANVPLDDNKIYSNISLTLHVVVSISSLSSVSVHSRFLIAYLCTMSCSVLFLRHGDVLIFGILCWIRFSLLTCLHALRLSSEFACLSFLFHLLALNARNCKVFINRLGSEGLHLKKCGTLIYFLTPSGLMAWSY